MRGCLGLLSVLLLAAVPSIAADCRPISGVEAVLEPGLVVVLGELHGTAESPAFLLDVACHAAAAGLPLLVGLELPTGERGRIETFLDSAGTADDRAAAIAGPRWQSDYQDGRTSLAMLDLLDGLRRLHAQGHSVRVLPFDVGTTGGNQARDRGMGETLAVAVKMSPRALTLVLTGNLHSPSTRGRRANLDYEPMTYVLKNRIAPRNIISLDVGYGGGSAWICAPECGVVSINGSRGARPWTIAIDDDVRTAGHHGRYFVGKITASRPARAPSADVAHPAEPAAETPVTGESAAPVNPAKPTGQLTPGERRFQGRWQSYDFSSNSRSWKMRFDGRNFRAEGGADDWYSGYVTIRADTSPAQIDFTIEDCVCDLKGTTSSGIYYEDDDSIVISAPRPGVSRPSRFVESNADMLRLRRLDP